MLHKYYQKNCFTQASLFLNQVWDKRIHYNYSSDMIGNMDKTTLSLNVAPNKSVVKKGGKFIIINTQKQEKCRISVLSTIMVDDSKLLPHLIFKCKTNGTNEN